MLPLVSTIESIKSELMPKRVTRIKNDKIPRSIQHFTLSYEEWQAFYQRKIAKVAEDWHTQLAEYITRANVTCSVSFKKHHVRAKGSRKKNTNLFRCHGQCQREECPLGVSVTVQEGPKKQGDPVVFKVYVFHEQKHNGTAQRPLKGVRRTAMGMFDSLIAP